MSKPTCLNCDTVVSKRTAKYCGHKCQNDYQFKTWIDDWKAGKHDGIKGAYQTANPIRRYLMQIHNNKCQQCGWGEVNPYTNKIPLEIDHIDGNYKNNRPENLRLLCPNCHALTATYKASNKGNGRKARKKYS